MQEEETITPDSAARNGRVKQEGRADAILDAAGELIQRWGYNKTTVDDIAKKAGVAKGTIYLHWKTREALFEALMERERRIVTEEFQKSLAADPEGATLHNTVKHSLLATSKHPLMKAVLMRDQDILGKWIQSERNIGIYNEEIGGFKLLLELMSSQGLVRKDIEVRDQIYIISMISIGMLLVDQWLPEDLRVSDEEAVELVAETVKRTLEVPASNTESAVKVVSTEFDKYMTHMTDLMKDPGAEEQE